MSELSNDLAPKPSSKIPVLRWVGTLLSVGLLIYLIAREWSAIITSVKELAWYYLVGSILLMFASRISVWIRWHILLRSGGVPATWRQSLRLVFAGLFASNFLPTTVGGDLVRFAGAVRLKYDPAVSAASLVMDRLVGMAGMATVLPIGLVRFFSLPLPALPGNDQPDVNLGSLSLAGILQWAILKVRKLFASAWQALRLWASHPRSLLLAYLATWGHMLSMFAIVWMLLISMNEPISFWMVAGLWSMSYFFTLLPISVNGLGLQELSLTFLFTNYGGVSLHSVVVMALLMRVLQILASLPGAVFVPALLQPAEDVR